MNKMSLEFKAKTSNISFARSTAQAFLMGLDFSISYLNEIKTIVSEAVTNSIVHGYQRDESKDVLLEMAYDEDSIYINVFDNGKGIEDIEKAKEPLFTTDELERSGLGFTIMEVFSDQLIVESVNGTQIYMMKSREQKDEEIL